MWGSFYQIWNRPKSLSNPTAAKRQTHLVPNIAKSPSSANLASLALLKGVGLRVEQIEGRCVGENPQIRIRNDQWCAVSQKVFPQRRCQNHRCPRWQHQEALSLQKQNVPGLPLLLQKWNRCPAPKPTLALTLAKMISISLIAALGVFGCEY